MRLVRRNFNQPAFLPNLWNELLSDDFFNQKGKENKACTTNYWQNKPAVNIKSTAENYAIELAAPGFDKADFSVELEDNLLTISAKKEAVSEKENEGYTHKEFSSKAFKRSFTIPEKEVDAAGIKANYEAGILTLSIPKKELEETKLKIDIS